MESRNWKIGCAGAFTTTFAIYFSSLHPSLPGGDSGELVVAAHEFGVAHPPGYPLFTVLAKLFTTAIPLGSVSWRVNLLSSLYGALCASFVYVLVYKLTFSHGASLLGWTSFSFSRLVWTWSTSAEVFSLNNLLLAALMYSAVDFSVSVKESWKNISLRGSFLCGLCLSNQHTSVLYIIILAPWILNQLWMTQKLSLLMLIKLTLAFLGGLLPYLYLPLSSTMHVARWTWGDQTSLKGFLTHLLRVEYGTWDLLKNHTGQGLKAGLKSYLTHLLSDLSVPVALLAVLSAFSVYYRHRRGYGSILFIFYLMLLVYLSFFCWRANLDIDNPLFFKVVERFWMQSDLIVTILAAVTFSDVCSYVSHGLKLQKVKLDVLVVIPLVAAHIHQWWPVCNNSNNFIIHDFAKQSLDSFPRESIILTKGDLPSNSFRYFHLCENVRQDLTVFDQEVLTYEWSLPMMRQFYPKIKFPGDLMQYYTGLKTDGRKAFRFVDLIDANYNRGPIFACIGVQDHEPSWQENYILWPFGVCWQFVRKGTTLDITKWTNSTAYLANQWSYAWQRYDDGSWEHVANSEMWRAKTVTALFYLELALEMPEGNKEQTQLLLQSYKLYTEAVEKHKSFPSYWHRNYAIVCERLTRADTSLDQLMLLRTTVHHFREFVNQEPFDKDSPKMRKAIKTLQDYIDTMS